MQQEEELSPEELTALLSSYMPEIPGYRVLRRIGKGGMSQVYLGVQESLDRQVAIKVMSPSALTDEISKQRFEQEARTIAKLEHPCIVGIHEVGRTRQGLLYYVLPYLAKGHLGQRDFTHDEDRVVEVLRSLLSALEYAHARGIVHRDVKAENVLFDNADRPLLTDFGIALSKRDSTRITTAGLAVGSGGYMAPEQARGEVVDGRADLYSVGVLAFELLTGHLPYQAADPLALALMHAQDPIPRLPAEKRHWQPFIDRAMAKSPDNRYRNAQQMLGALNQIAGGRPPEPAFDLSRLKAFGRTWWKPAAGVAGALLVVALAAAWWGREGPETENDFFTVEAAPPEPVAVPGPAAEPAAAEPGPDDLPAPAATASPGPAPAPDPYANVSAELTVTSLDYDPTRPGARELAAARRQMERQRLSLPPGDNAMESLRRARELAPNEPALFRLSDQVIGFYVPRILDAVRAGRDQEARDNYGRVAPFVAEMQRGEARVWTGLREGLVPLLASRLQAGLDALDAEAVARTKALATDLGVPSEALEPAWSRAIELPKAGDVLADGAVLLVLPRDGRPGLAAMRHEVTRADYAAFASSTRREAARCRNRLAPISLKRRRWDDPGFAQGGNHPVVCVSFDDARAYAQWLGQRSGHNWRVPTRAEWRPVADHRGSGNACRDGRIACGSDGTAAAGAGPTSPLGLAGTRGNVREWLADCERGCARRLAGGLGWRDPPDRANPLQTNDFDADVGFDDIGFRLVRDVAQAELERR
ncbi:bifunctional serine/threonine-protein kinase/formylglycine-generating enzyme family protein [Arenimonas fontis]|uniref:Protein kinase n=1 Tax=Arenimonas fontis TaxID=2608255 RepID=A0A5B2ZGT1_9GAMM|nr:bifunctional serine/threonine-protein kinase/formylglycine-generating enzyme family protein [Arenimonas fontis]KAA2286281.1 protein kinase [Arenimonas fontis]